MNLKLVHGAMVVALTLATAASAAEEAPLAVVNGTTISVGLLNRALEPLAAQGQKDSPQLRSVLTEELIARELLAQEARKRGLDTLKTTEDALLILRQNLLMDVLINDELAKKPITQDDLKAEYERQTKLLKSNDLQQFQLSVIVLETEAQARAVLAEVKSGKAFDVLAKARSMDPSKEKGGDLGWILSDQLTPAIANVVVNLSLGSVSAAPIQVGPLWHVVKMVGKRPYEIPAYQDSQQQLQAAVVQQRRLALLQKLRETAKITR